jgi:hypothetical protein
LGCSEAAQFTKFAFSLFSMAFLPVLQKNCLIQRENEYLEFSRSENAPQLAAGKNWNSEQDTP